MAKRKKRMKLPNGYGSIKYLGEHRRHPYAAYPPVETWTAAGPVTPPALGYYETWEEAYQYLTAWHMEKSGQIKVNRGVYIDRTPTFAQIYEAYFDEKYNRSAKKLSVSSKNSTAAAFKNCAALHDVQFGQIRYGDLQAVVDSCPLKHSSLELIVTLFRQMYAYAIKYDIVSVDYSQHVYIPIADDDESGVPFTPEELSVLWQHQEDPTCRMILILCYSGFRVAEATCLEVNLEERYFRGGVKTAAGKNRLVPIHSGILPLVTLQYKGTPNLLGCSTVAFRSKMYSSLEALGFPCSQDGRRHTPHDCRHTFSALLEHYGVNENDRKRLLGHSFHNDVTNSVYGHRSLDDLRKSIELVGICY